MSMKKIISLFLITAMLSSSVLVGCSNENKNETSTPSEQKTEKVSDPIANIKAEKSTDKYRNYYEIFVNSFCDSNGDTIGDLQGVISQLDYLNDGDPNSGNDLGVDGIWLTPIMPSKSYHKYDVEDYYDIDEVFGTLEDFDKLVDECHKRGINIIIDLVLNHISSQNPLYLNAVKEVEEGKLDGDAEYFEIHKKSYFSADTQVNDLANDYACEANFSHDMPEWNLNSDKTRKEFAKIAKFWIDRGVDGFRLDATKFYTNADTDGAEFLGWFYDTCQEMKPDIYMVGENWTDNSQILEMCESGIDSFFAFKYAQASGSIVKGILSESGAGIPGRLMSYENKAVDINKDYINALFLSNHDQVRIANALNPLGLSYEKFAASVYMLFPGNPFIYYGEEIGVAAAETSSDAYYRSAMIFDSENLPVISVNARDIPIEAPSNGGVKQQLDDENSLLNFYRRIIKIKLQNPEIARGRITGVQDFGDAAICAYYIEHNNSKLMIIHNFSKEQSKTVTITDDMLKNAVLRADLVTGDSGHIAMVDGKITLPAQSSVILKAAE